MGQEDVHLLHYMGIALVAIGLVTTVFARPFGVGFCRLGKRIWRGNPFGMAVQEEVDRIYDERKAPRIMRILGIVNLVQGAAFLAIGQFWPWAP